MKARREAQIQAAHDAAIFGPPPSMSGIQNDHHDHTRFSLKELDEDINKHKEEQTPPITNLVSEQVEFLPCLMYYVGIHALGFQGKCHEVNAVD